MARRWRIRSIDQQQIEQLQRATGLPAVVAQLLVQRGIDDPEAARDFLSPPLTSLRDPEQLPGAIEAARRVAAAISAGRRICVYGDYDADGMTGASILFRCLKLLEADVAYYVPHRIEEGYGLNDQALAGIAQQGASLVITVDCGIASVAEAETARQLGLELIVTDHHDMGSQLPEAAALVHPRLPGHSCPFTGLAGAGVALKVAWAICQQVSQSKKVRPAMRTFLLQALGLAAIGTVADVVPLVDENRVLVRHGLNCLREKPTIGLKALMRVAGLAEKPTLSSEDVAFALAPRLNAAGRLGQAELAIELLTTDSERRASDTAEYLNELNNSRGSLERSVYLSADKQIRQRCDPAHEPALVAADTSWHPGVIGIVAGKLSEKYHRPVVLIALDELGVRHGTGSGRSIPGFNLHEAISACREHLVSCGGHAAAAGLRIDARHVDAFREAFSQHAAETLDETDLSGELLVDAEAPFSSLTMETVKQIESLSPFGAGNRRPVLCTSDVRLVAPPRRMGGGGRHVSMTLSQHGVKLRAVAFGNGDWADELADHQEPLAVAFQPVINQYRGWCNVELHLTAWHTEPQLAATSEG